MAIHFECTACSNTLDVPDGSEGQQAECPACSVVLEVPAAPLADSESSDTPTDTSQASINPYASTFNIDDPVSSSSDPTGELSVRQIDVGSQTSAAFMAVAVVCTLAYLAFTGIVFFSGGHVFCNRRWCDRPQPLIGEIMFLVNTPVFIGLAVSAFRSTRMSVYFAIGATVVQSGIAIAMLVMRYGDLFIVLKINSAIILACLAIAIRAWWSGTFGKVIAGAMIVVIAILIALI